MAYGSFAPPAYPQSRQSPPPLPDHLRRQSGAREAFREIPPTGIMIAADSVVAKKHPDNEDRFDMRGGVSLVADGVGSYGGGALASETARRYLQPEEVRVIMEQANHPDARTKLARIHSFLTKTSFESVEEVEALMHETLLFLDAVVEKTIANSPTVAKAAETRAASMLGAKFFDSNDPKHRSMKMALIKSNSTTAVLGRTWKYGDRVKHTVGSVGDSGEYLIRDNAIEKLTLDQSPTSILIQAKVKNTRGELLTPESVEQDLNQTVRTDELLRLAASGQYPELDSAVGTLVQSWNKTGRNKDTCAVYQACQDRKIQKLSDMASFMRRALHLDETRSGEEATFSLREINHIMYGAIGAGKVMKQMGLELKPHIKTIEIFANDVIIKVSDGISENVPSKDILKSWNKCRGDVERFKTTVIAEARRIVEEEGGKDDDMTITVEYFTAQDQD